jgi:hypothetical protein
MLFVFLEKLKGSGMQSASAIVTYGTHDAFVSGLEKWEQQREQRAPPDLCNHLLLDVATSRVDTVQKVKHLLTMGADVNARRVSRQWRNVPSWEAPANQGKHVLAIAVHANAPELVQLLLENGADVNATFTSRGHGARSVSSINTSLTITKLLVQYGVNLTCQDAGSFGPLPVAAAFGKVRTVAFLLEQGVDPNLQSRTGVTALHRATVSRKPGTVKIIALLLAAGANPHLRCNYPGIRAVPQGCGYTPLQRIRGAHKSGSYADKKTGLLTDAMLHSIEERRAAFAMALQERLGANSAARVLNTCVMQLIMASTVADHCDPKYPALPAFPSSKWILLGYEAWSSRF